MNYIVKFTWRIAFEEESKKSEPTLDYERTIESMDLVELAKWRLLAGGEAVGASAGVEVMEVMDIVYISDGMCTISRTAARP